MGDQQTAGKAWAGDGSEIEGKPESSVDWLTVTAKEERNRWRLRSAAVSLLRWEERGGNERSQHSSRWYWVERCGSTSAGERDEDSMVSVSGRSAALHWRMLAAAAERSSRLDLAVTLCLKTAYPGLCRDAYAALASAPARPGRPTSARLLQGLPRGVTLYLGAPQSEVMGRAYDKGAEAESHPDGVRWRWEVQFKNAHALAQLRELERYADPADRIAAVVKAWFERRGVQVPWVATEGSCGSLQPDAPASDDARRLEWLQKGVAPTLRKLAERGKLSEALAALGLDKQVRGDASSSDETSGSPSQE